MNSTGLCAVPNVRGMRLAAAKRSIAQGHCRLGETRRAYSRTVKTGRVISQTPWPGSVLPKRGKVNLVVSRGRK
jgi:beta-lactam-binding protein with PASTA domain